MLGCVTSVAGSTKEHAPIYTSECGLNDEVKAKLMMLAQGRLLAKSAKYPQPVFLKFPFPTCLPGERYSD
jgi:hypothetical protein